MIVEKRSFVMRSGTISTYLNAFEQEGYALQKEFLGEGELAFLVSETGPLEQVVQLWAYADWNDREERRKALFADPRFKSMSEKMHPLIQHKNTQLLAPTSFSRLGQQK